MQRSLHFLFSYSFYSLLILIYLMKTFLFWFFLLLLIIIHTIDMELTMYYIGNQWQNETFPLMQLCIKKFGIYHSIWLSRITTYLYFLISYYYRHNNYYLFSMFLITVVYYTAMIDWLFTLV